MKILSAFIISLFVAAGAFAQTATRTAVTIATRDNAAVKGLPFSAEAVSESVQTLADGNKIARKWTTKIYRSSDGRTRREGSDVPGMAFGTPLAIAPAITVVGSDGNGVITDGQMNVKKLRTFKVEGEDVVVADAPAAAPGEDVKIFVRRQGGSGEAMAAPAIAAGPVAIARVDPSDTIVLADRANSKTEQLGVQSFDGINAEGTRTTTTIPAGAIGNERPIEIVYERWYSNELKALMYSKHSDPRFGEQTYRLTNIVRSEPDPALFQLTSPRMIRRGTATGVGNGPNVVVERVVKGEEVPADKP